MKRLLLVSLVLLLTSISTLRADQQNVDRYTYCCIIGYGGSKYTDPTLKSVQFDFGNKEEEKKANLIDEAGKQKSFNSMVDAMEYMSAFGWELSQTSVFAGNLGYVFHWVVRKKLD